MNSTEESSSDFCPNYVHEFGLWIVTAFMNIEKLRLQIHSYLLNIWKKSIFKGTVAWDGFWPFRSCGKTLLGCDY